MRENRHKILLVVPFATISRGIEAILEESGEMSVNSIAPDALFSNRMQSIYADAIIVAPSVFSYSDRLQARQMLAECCSAPVLALPTSVCEDDVLRQYDGIINLSDSPSAIVKKVNDAIHSSSDQQKSDDDVLTAREKEVLVCVAKGMQNKEIADLFNISTYTVMSHRKNISRKTGIRSAAGMTVYALLNNLMDLNNIDEK